MSDSDGDLERESPQDKSYRLRITPHDQPINGPLATVQNVTYNPITGTLDVEADTPGDSKVMVEVLEERDGGRAVVALELVK